MKFLSYLSLLSSVIPPPCAEHLPLPHSLHLPKLFSSVNFPFFLFPPPCPWTCVLCYASALPEQTGLLIFTIGPRLEGWQTHKGSASLQGAAKKLKEGIVGTQQASALHQPRLPCKKCVHAKWAYRHTYVAHILQQQTPTCTHANCFYTLFLFPSDVLSHRRVQQKQ